jgi:hypothetical protein
MSTLNDEKMICLMLPLPDVIGNFICEYKQVNWRGRWRPVMTSIRKARRCTWLEHHQQYCRLHSHVELCIDRAGELMDK